MIDLTFVSSDALMEEFRRRCDSFALVAIMGKSPTEEGLWRMCKGSKFTCLGMLAAMKAALMREIDNDLIKDKT